MTRIRDASIAQLLAAIVEIDGWDDLIEALSDEKISSEFHNRGITYNCDCDECPELDEPLAGDREIQDAYRAMDAGTPEPIRSLILDLSGRIT